MTNILISKELLEDIYFKRNLRKLSGTKLSRLCNKYDKWINNIECNKVKFISGNNLLQIYRTLMLDKSEKEIIEYLRNLLNSKDILKSNKELCKEKMEYSYRKFIEKLDSIDENDIEALKILRTSLEVQMISLIKELYK